VPTDEVYRRLRDASPAPWGAWMRLGGPEILSISPELFLSKTGDVVSTRPIKGTRPRSSDPAEDARLYAELEASEKDRAELAMIVDLLRNDLGRVARTGSVRVVEGRSIHAHPTVFHAVATVEASVGRDVHAADLVRATMPGGSITGAPKIRAMEILEELEDVRRGPYCGSAGWFGYDGDLRLNILIRTLVVHGEEVSFHVGGGIVADSDPAAEYEETLVKARAMISALSGGAR
jgi:para-aminobenzoate synthetase component 1